jgi:hypothetical protein
VVFFFLVWNLGRRAILTLVFIQTDNLVFRSVVPLVHLFSWPATLKIQGE